MFCVYLYLFILHSFQFVSLCNLVISVELIVSNYTYTGNNTGNNKKLVQECLCCIRFISFKLLTGCLNVLMDYFCRARFLR